MLTLTTWVDPTIRNVLTNPNDRRIPIRTILNGRNSRNCRNVPKIPKIPKILSYRDAAPARDRALVQATDPALAPATVLELGQV